MTLIEYDIRTPFRIAAWLPGVFAVAVGIRLAFAGVDAIVGGEFGVLMLIGAGLIGATGIFFLRLGWTGRVPAFIEEYGLDGPGEVENHRAVARQEGRLHE